MSRVLEVVVGMGFSGSWGRPCVPSTALMVSSGCLTKVMTLEVSLVVSVTGLGKWWDDMGSEVSVVAVADVVAGGS